MKPAIELSNASDSSPDGSVRVSWAMRKVGDWLARATGDEFRLYPEGASISKLDRKNIGLRAAAQYERVVPIDIANYHPLILVAKVTLEARASRRTCAAARNTSRRPRTTIKSIGILPKTCIKHSPSEAGLRRG